MAKHRTLLLTSCLSLLVAGCGGGGGGVGSTPTPTPTPSPPPTNPTPTPSPTPTPTPSTNFNTAEYQRSSAAKAKAITAYNAGASGAGVKIAIVDSGLTNALGEFTGRIDPASRDMTNSNRGYADGDTAGGDNANGHGTSVTAVAAASRNNAEIMGVAYNATILALRTDNPGSCASSTGCEHLDSDLARAVDYARTNGARVINMSLGGSAMSSGLQNAINTATAAGVIVVVSAGNCGEVSSDCATAATQPDIFAQVASTPAAHGLVIIAGAHNASNMKSDFSNPAGSYGTWYLAAYGGQAATLKDSDNTNNDGVRSFNNVGKAFLYTGTSYAAPAISGAVALLAQAFPNMSSADIVDLLMSTATDAGASLGNGILNLDEAFRAQGATSLPGLKTPISMTDNGILSAAMGDASVAGASGPVILDKYARAYRLNLGATIQRMGLTRPLNGAIGNDIRSTTLDLGDASIAMRVAGTTRFADSSVARWMGDDGRAFTNHPAANPRAVGGEMRFRLGARTMGFASFGQRINAAPVPEASWLIANQPSDSPGFEADRDIALGIRHELGRFGLTVTGEQGNALRQRPDRIAPKYTLISARVDRTIGALRMGTALGMMREDGSVLGARFGAALGGGGATTRLADIDLGLMLGAGWSLRGQWRQAWTDADTGGMLTSGTLSSNAFSFDIVRQGRVSRLGLRLAQPLRVENGRFRLNVPTSYEYATLSTGYTLTDLNLAPKGRELDLEANYGRMVGAGWLDANLFYRREPGNIASMSGDIGAAMRFTLGF